MHGSGVSITLSIPAFHYFAATGCPGTKLAAVRHVRERPCVTESSGSSGYGSAAGLSSRRLSVHQQAVLIQVLLAFPGESAGVCYSRSSDEARAYAEDFLNIFKAINWSVEDAESVVDLPAASHGVAIIVKEKHLPSSAEALRDALRIYHLEAEILDHQNSLCGSRKFVLAIT
jgi:hypothetical protein